MPKRKLIQFDSDIYRALEQLAQDRMATFQELADEAFADVLKKHHRPVGPAEALKESAKRGGKSNVVQLKAKRRKVK
ncbi:MAG: hypothetical protein ABUL48_01400 [Pseudorhodoplanes sp.]